MKAIALANRLLRNLDVPSLSDLAADSRLEMVDAINGALQTLHALAPYESKTAYVSLSVSAPTSVTITVTQGSATITGYSFSDADQYRTIRIPGDDIDNQVVGADGLLYPYWGESGTVEAMIYSDAIALPEPYAELIEHPRILENNTEVPPQKPIALGIVRSVACPTTYWVESNARNQNPSAPALIRFNPMPDRGYRMTARVLMAPVRITFSDLIAPGADIPLRAEHVESYLIPIAKAALTHSDLWKHKDDIASVRDEAKEAKKEYEILTPQTLTTPRNRTKTKSGF